MLWVSPLEQKQLLGWLGVKGHTGVCLPCLPAAISLQLSLSLRLQENCSKHQEQVEQSGPRRRRGYLCVFHAVGHLRICRVESTVLSRIVFSVYVRSEGWLPDENSPSVGLPHPSVTGCATCSIASPPVPPNPGFGAGLVSSGCVEFSGGLVHAAVYLGTERNLVRDRLTNCKVLWLQEFATKRFLVSVLVKTGHGLDSPYLSKPLVLR